MDSLPVGLIYLQLVPHGLPTCAPYAPDLIHGRDLTDACNIEKEIIGLKITVISTWRVRKWRV